MASNARLFQGLVWRCVTAETTKPRSKLVASPADYLTLTDMLSQVAADLPSSIKPFDRRIQRSFENGPWLLQASRFRPARGGGVFYAALDTKTALAEQGWHRRNFAQDYSPSQPVAPMPLEVFSVTISGRFVDVDDEVFAKSRGALLDKTDYSASRRFSLDASSAGLDGVLYPSVRLSPAGRCVAVLRIEAITSPAPVGVTSRWRFSFADGVGQFFEDQTAGLGASFSHEYL